MQGMRIPSLGQEVPLDGGMATHSSILASKVPWTEGLGGLHGVLTELNMSVLTSTRTEAAGFFSTSDPARTFSLSGQKAGWEQSQAKMSKNSTILIRYSNSL